MGRTTPDEGLGCAPCGKREPTGLGVGVLFPQRSNRETELGSEFSFRQTECSKMEHPWDARPLGFWRGGCPLAGGSLEFTLGESFAPGQSKRGESRPPSQPSTASVHMSSTTMTTGFPRIIELSERV